MQVLYEVAQETFTVINLVMLAFFTFAVWFNYRAGFKSGVQWGTDATLIILEKDQVISLERTQDGDIFIRAGEKGKSKQL
jgi:hypothetical protein